MPCRHQNCRRAGPSSSRPACWLVAALAVSTPGFMLAKGRSRPLLATKSFWPAKRDIDRPLVVGAALFGLGWGLVGLRPGPALENLATLSPGIIVFVAAMAGGMALHDFWQNAQAEIRNEGALANADG